MKKGIEVLHESGIIVMGNVIIGANLDDTVEDVLITIKRTRELTLDLPSFTLLTPFPATGFYIELKEKNLLLTEDYSKYNWLTPVIKTQNFSPKVLRKLLFLGFYHVGFYGGDWPTKWNLLRRGIKSRGIKYIFHPGRAYRTVKSYFTWRKIVMDNIQGLNKEQRNQLLLGNVNDMIELKQAIIKGS